MDQERIKQSVSLLDRVINGTSKLRNHQGRADGKEGTYQYSMFYVGTAYFQATVSVSLNRMLSVTGALLLTEDVCQGAVFNITFPDDSVLTATLSYGEIVELDREEMTEAVISTAVEAVESFWIDGKHALAALKRQKKTKKNREMSLNIRHEDKSKGIRELINSLRD